MLFCQRVLVISATGGRSVNCSQCHVACPHTDVSTLHLYANVSSSRTLLALCRHSILIGWPLCFSLSSPSTWGRETLWTTWTWWSLSVRSVFINIHLFSLFVIKQSEHICDFLTFLRADGVVLIDPEYLKERKGETWWFNILMDFICEQNQNL